MFSSLSRLLLGLLVESALVSSLLGSSLSLLDDPAPLMGKAPGLDALLAGDRGELKARPRPSLVNICMALSVSTPVLEGNDVSPASFSLGSTFVARFADVATGCGTPAIGISHTASSSPLSD